MGIQKELMVSLAFGLCAGFAPWAAKRRAGYRRQAPKTAGGGGLEGRTRAVDGAKRKGKTAGAGSAGGFTRRLNMLAETCCSTCNAALAPQIKETNAARRLAASRSPIGTSGGGGHRLQKGRLDEGYLQHFGSVCCAEAFVKFACSSSRGKIVQRGRSTDSTETDLTMLESRTPYDKLRDDWSP